MDPLHDDSEGIGFPLEKYYQSEGRDRKSVPDSTIMSESRKIMKSVLDGEDFGLRPKVLPDLTRVAGIRKEEEAVNPLLCEHDLEPTGEEFLTQLDNVSRLTRFVKCKKCGLEALDVFVYIGTFEKGE